MHFLKIGGRAPPVAVPCSHRMATETFDSKMMVMPSMGSAPVPLAAHEHIAVSSDATLPRCSLPPSMLAKAASSAPASVPVDARPCLGSLSSKNEMLASALCPARHALSKVASLASKIMKVSISIAEASPPSLVTRVMAFWKEPNAVRTHLDSMGRSPMICLKSACKIELLRVVSAQAASLDMYLILSTNEMPTCQSWYGKGTCRSCVTAMRIEIAARSGSLLFAVLMRCLSTKHASVPSLKSWVGVMG